MAKCKLCKTNIPDGTEYCNDCQDKKKSNETYLDSLLNSVKNTAPSAENIYKKKINTDKKSSETNISKDPESEQEPELDDYDMYRVDLSDIEDFDQFDFNDDINDDDIIIGDKELFGEDLASIFKDDSSKDTNNEEILDLNKEINEILNTSDEPILAEEDVAQNTDTLALDGNSKDEKKEEILLSDPLLNNINQNEILDFQEDDSMDPDLNDLLKSLELSDDETYSSTENEYLPSDEYSSSNEEELQFFNDDMDPTDDDNEQMETNDDDFLSLLNQISSDDPVVEDVKAINDLLNNESAASRNKSVVTSDVGDVFSDALKVVSSLNDNKFDEEDLLSKLPENKSKKSKQKKKIDKKSKKDKELNAKAEKPKMGLFKRLFSNVEDEDTAKKAKKAKVANSEPGTTPKNKSKKKAAKNLNVAEISDSDNEESLDDKKAGKDKNDNKKSSKKDKVEKKKKTKEIIEVIDEIEEDEGRINRLGASIVFLFFALLVMVLLAGTNIVSYSLSIQNATNYFEKQKYTQAYNEVYGIEIKDEDIEIYDKIMTVMFVNKQLNSYNNYYSLGQYPEALDSLLKGLKRYDKYIELATMLGIKSDLDYVRDQILAELDNVYELSKEDALRILNYESMEEYSLEVYDIVLENMGN